VIRFCKWKNSLERFVHHESRNYYRDSVAVKVGGVRRRLFVSGTQGNVAVQRNHQAKQQMLDNRRKCVAIIIETIIFCRRQGISQRGHRNSGPLSFVEAKSGGITMEI